MKKLALVFLVAIILSCSFGTLAESEITFRKIAWFSTPLEVDGALLSEGATNTNYALGRSDFALRMDFDSQGVISPEICTGYGITNSYSGITVAGYSVDFLMVSYLYPLVNNQVVKDDSLAQIHTGMYVLQIPETSSAKEAYHDLTRKLSYLYGTYTVGVSEEISDSEFPPRIWADVGGNIVILTISGGNAQLVYYAGDANSRLDDLQFSSSDSLNGL